MTNLKIFSDSTCDLSQSDIEQMDIGIIPLTVTFDNTSYKDKAEINTKELLTTVNNTGILPTTASPSPNNFYESFLPYINNNIPVLYIGLCSKLSSTIANAHIAASMLPQGSVYIVDSLNLCGGLGALVRIAYRLKKQNMHINDIVSYLNKIAPNYKLFFIMNKLDYLYKGGRCSGLEYTVGSLLGIKPIIQMSPNGLQVFKKVRGKKKAVKYMVSELLKDINRILFSEIHIASIYGSNKQREELKQTLKEASKVEIFHEYDIGCTIASHCGDGTFGFGYFIDTEKN
ncbi:DegV family protein [Abyssisolibacter fermentans]|uniref:DegV family protein n=1 Tax=Abyssisolibacter fermentans TaxID=1766203 RepID=UPI0008295240|nr:DegV family protein [Abyssisolibacter fermentans]